MTHSRLCTLVAGVTALIAARADAQPLGTFTWQLQPFCNVVTVNVTQQGAVYTMDGYDDQCGAARRAPIVGLGTPNPDGTIGLGWNIVTTPGGRGVQVDARITLPSASGSWTDSAGNAGTLALGASTGGSARPLPPTATVIPGTFALLPDGGFLARGTGSVTPIPASGPGFRMMWHPSKAAFRAGNVGGTQWDDVNIGIASTATGAGTMASGAYSVAMGFGATASGEYSTATGSRTTASGNFSAAMGNGTVASGSQSTAMGRSTTASGITGTAMGELTAASGVTSTAMGYATIGSGPVSTAMGHSTTASADSSTAMGGSTRASAFASTAMGWESTASGAYSTAMGFRSTASGVSSTATGVLTMAAGLGSTVMGTYAEATSAAPGSFVYGDRSTGQSRSVVTSVTPNQFLVRAAGGVAFWSTPSTVYPTSPGVILFSGDSFWSSLSDVNSKENFRDLTDDDVLAKLAAMPVREWNYKAQDAAIRHVGPTAQDFHAAFGLGTDARRIGSVDADGIALAAVKALEARTRALPDDARALRDQVAALARDNDDLRARLARLEALLDKH